MEGDRSTKQSNFSTLPAKRLCAVKDRLAVEINSSVGCAIYFIPFLSNLYVDYIVKLISTYNFSSEV